MGIINSIKSSLSIRNEVQMYGQFKLRLLHADVYSLCNFMPGVERLYLCVSGKEAVILMIDAFQGDELADEVPFDGEMPLYFSCTSKRVSPVFRLYAVTEALSEFMNAEVASFYSVLITSSNIINEIDMEPIWQKMGIGVRVVQKMDGLTVSVDKRPDYLKDFIRLHEGGKDLESKVDLIEYGKFVSSDTSDVGTVGLGKALRQNDDSGSSLFVELDAEKIIDRNNPVFHTLQADGTSSYSRSNLPSVRVFAPIRNPEAVLDQMVGLDGVKSHVRRLRNLALYKKRIARHDIQVHCPPISLHSCFVGNPGTGKTTVAILLASLLHSAGALSVGNVIIANRASFLSRWVGSEERNVAMVLAMSKGSVLMIDEAHNLIQGANEMDYSRNVLPIMMTTLADESESARDFCVVLCGYEKELDKAMQTDPGIVSRFPNRFVFEDYNLDQLYEMILKRIEKSGYILQDDASRKIYLTLGEMYENRDPDKWSNAREVSLLWERILICHAERCVLREVTEDKELITITVDDIPVWERPEVKTSGKIGFR